MTDKYGKPEMEIISFELEDIVTVSSVPETDPDESDIVTPSGNYFW